MNWLFILVIAILGLSALMGAKKGLIKTVFSLFSMIAAIILTIVFSPVVHDFMKGNEKINSYISEKVDLVLELSEVDKKAEESVIEGIKLPDSIKQTLIENNTDQIYKALGVDTFSEYINQYLTAMIINAIAFIVTFLVIYIALLILSSTLDLISKLPVLNTINKTGGLLVGLARGLIMIWIFFVVITAFGGSVLGSQSLAMINDNEILKWIYDRNIFMSFISNAKKIIG